MVNRTKYVLASFIDADVHNEDSNYEEKFWTVLDKGGDKEGTYIANG